MAIADDLHLHMARAAHQLFQVHLVVAERRRRLAPRRLDLAGQVCLAFDHAHAAPAAAPAGLEHQRIAERGSLLGTPGQIARQGAGGRHHRHAGCHRRIARRDLVAQGGHHLRRGPDEDDAGGGAGARKLGVLREETIAGVNRIDLRLARDAHDVDNVQVGIERLFAFTHQITLVCLEAMQREAVFV